MNERNILSALKSLNVSIAAKGGNLLISDPDRQLTPELRAAIVERKSDLLRLLEAAPAELSALPPIAPADERDSYPLSPGQARIYALQSLAPESVAYNVQLAYRFERPLDEDRLKRALQNLVARHESLRTSFHMEDEGIVQRIHSSVTVEIERESTRAGALAERALAFTRAFDLSHAPLFRVRAFALDDGRSAVAFDVHHIITDGVSMQLLIRDFNRLLAGETLAAPSLQFKDFALWQTEGKGRALLDRQAAYWIDQYKSIPAPLSLPTDRPRPKLRSLEGAALELEMRRETVEALRAMRRSQNVTLYVALHACYSALLAKLSGQEDIVLGTAVAGRDAPGLEDTIGMFTNTLALRSAPSREKPFQTYLAEIRALCLGAFGNALYPFEELVERIQLGRDSSRNPLFDAMLILQNYESAQATVAGESTPVALETQSSKIDITLSVIESTSSIQLRFEYATALFDEATIRKLASRLERLICHAAEAVRAPIGELEIIDEEERQQMLVGFNATRVAYPKDLCIHEIVARTCERQPDAVAVVAGEAVLTYRELDERSSRLARKLRSHLALGRDSIIGLMAKRNTDLIVAQLGILKAGAAYLPIDPGYPSERIEYMLADSGCHALLASGASELRLGFDGPTLDLAESANLPEDGKGSHSDAVSPAELAYVIYTSGSTGQPKGVMIEHRAVANLMVGMRNAVGLAAGRSIVSVTTICFDIFALESLLPLMLGMSIVMADESAQIDPAELCSLVQRSGADVLQATPSLAKLVFAEPYAKEGLRGVKTLLIGGEPFTEALRTLARENTTAAIYNMYGPTETTVWSTTALVSDDRIHIGKPIANTRIYIVEPRGSALAPLGCVGELCIGGDGLARGYHGREELTREKFVANPFEPGGRMYRTGDLARWLPTGELECLGRIDGQVKIRGHRIELGEIEAALAKVETVGEAVVAVKTINGVETLVAYYVADRELDLARLREALGASLPTFMVPSIFARLDAIPLTANGKIDRRSLPQPTTPASSRADYAPPRTETERVLVEIWRSVLGLEKVGIRDDFYELGGDSLLMIRVASKAKHAGLTVLPAQLMEATTIARLAGLLAASGPSAELGSAIGPLPLSPMQRTFFAIPIRRRWVIPARFDLRRRIEIAQLRQAVSVLWEHHDGLRCRFANDGGEWSAFIPEPEPGAIEEMVWAEDLSALPEAEQWPILARAWHELRKDLDFQRGRNLRIVLYDRGPDRPQHLHIILHHLVADAETMRLFLGDLAAVCMQITAGQAPRLPPKSTPLRTVFERIDAAGRSDELLAQLPFWNSIPWSRMKRPAIDTGLGVERNTFDSVIQARAELGAETTAALQETLRYVGATMLDALLLAMAEGICAWSGGDWMHARTGSANGLVLNFAKDLDCSRTAAWFTTGQMFALPRPSALDPVERLREVKRAAEAIPSQGIGFDLLTQCSGRPELTDSLRRASNFDLFFNYLGRVEYSPPPGSNSPIVPVNDLPGDRVHDDSYRCGRGLLLFIEFLIEGGQLKVRCDYSRNLHHASTIENLLATMFRELESLAFARQPADARAAR